MKKIPVFYLILIFSFLINSEIFGNSTNQAQNKITGISVVVIDPGHGGRDPGAVSGRAQEKGIVLDIALKLGNYIKTNFPEVNVMYTRNSDIFIPLYQRAEIANKNNADLFISIHANSVNASSVQGAETFVLGQHGSQENLEVAKKENSVILLEDDYSTIYQGFDPNSPESYIMFELIQDEYLEQSVMFANDIQNQFKIQANRNDRSVKQAGFLVLKQTTMPSVLVEAGFVSNAAEREFLMSDQGRNRIALSIFNAFSEYKQKIEGKSNFNVVSNADIINNVVKTETALASTPDIYYTVQIAALQNSLDLIPANFQGEENVFRKTDGKIFRYYCGKFSSYNDAVKERDRLQRKFRGAFIVAFENED